MGGKNMEKNAIIMISIGFLIGAIAIYGVSSITGFAVGGQGKAQGDPCMANCMGDFGLTGIWYGKQSDLTQFCLTQCNPAQNNENCGSHDDGCCVPWTGDADCHGANALGQCDVLNCDDGITCTVDTCDQVTGCSNIPNSDVCISDQCNIGICDVANGDPNTGCLSQATPGVSCDGGNVCSLGDYCGSEINGVSYCTPGGDTLDCNDGNLCTYDNCDSVTGCVNTPYQGGECTDGDECTVDSCDPLTGCVFTPIEGCGTCTVDADCADEWACSNDNCNPSSPSADEYGCTHYYPTGGLVCTTAGCGLHHCEPFVPGHDANGCVFYDLGGDECDDGNACTVASCDLVLGCVFTPIPGCDACTGVICNDGDDCTVDSCDPVTGTCVFTPIPGCFDPCAGVDCDDANACTVDSCDPATGCVNEDISYTCDDGELCSTDTCDFATGCVNTGIDLCKPCSVNAECYFDNDPATNDYCAFKLGVCRHII
jgi:hypothetical protein